MQKFLAKNLAREEGERFAGVERQIGFVFALEESGDALAAVVQSRREDVRRLLVGKLKNKFGEIAFDNFDAVALENMVEVNFLAGHALALDDHLCGAPAANIEDVATGIGGGVGDEHVAVVRANRIFQRLDEIGKIGDRFVFDAARFVFQIVVIGQICRGAIAALVEMLRVGANGGAFDIERHANGAQ